MSANNKYKHSLLGVELLRELANKGYRIFSLKEARNAAPTVNMKPEYVTEALYHLKQVGWIEGLKRGLYAFTPESGIAEAPHDFEIAQRLVPGSVISYWSAMRFYEMTQQLPNIIQSMVTQGTSIPRKLNSNRLAYYQVKKEYFFGIKTIWINNAKVSITDPERTLLESLRHPELCGGFQEVLSAFGISQTIINLDKLMDYALKLETAVAKRLGWILEQIGIASATIKPLSDLSIKGPRKLNPNNPSKGSLISKWQLQDNR